MTMMIAWLLGLFDDDEEESTDKDNKGEIKKESGDGKSSKEE